MRNDPIGEVPSGYVVHRIGDTWLVLDQKRAPELVELRLADPASRADLFARSPRRGRGPTPVVPLSGGGAVVLRRYRHGGLFGRITGPLLLGPGRALRELAVTHGARERGAPVPSVLCLVLWPNLGPLWSSAIGTFEEPDARDLLEVLDSLPEQADRRRLARHAGAAIRRLHDAGVDHRDLHLCNILAVPDPGSESDRIVIVDLDRATFPGTGPLEPARRAQNLGRLCRSVVKSGLWRNPLGRREFASLIAGYTSGNRTLRRELRGRAARERASLWLHRLSYGVRSTRAGRKARSLPRRA